MGLIKDCWNHRDRDFSSLKHWMRAWAKRLFTFMSQVGIKGMSGIGALAMQAS